MARATPQVVDTQLLGQGSAPIEVGSLAWFAWLEHARLFAFHCDAGSFTARRERQAGGSYWRAYRTVHGQQRRAYLGRAADLSLERLRAVAAELAEPALADTGAPLLATKLYRPRPRGARVARARLIARLDRGLAGALTLIAAPAGFGKTSLLAEWLASPNFESRVLSANSATMRQTQDSKLKIQDYHAAWLALDVGDNDPSTFTRYLVAALRTVAPAPLGAAALALLEAREAAPPATLLATIANDLAALAQGSRARYVLALDDYHMITAPTIHAGLAWLLEHLPPNLHLVIASREDPPLPLARLRAYGQLSELRAADLRFTTAEAGALLRDVMGLPISAAEADALEQRTEGWAAGLQLAALALHDRASGGDRAAFIAEFTGSNRFVVDYLAGEVLDRLPPHLREFVLRTALLDQLCAELCDAILDEGRGTKSESSSSFTLRPSSLVLDELERANLFLVPLDDQRRWYRYHQLFADVLRAQLAHTHAPELVAELHRRASAWLAEHGRADAAIEHALAAGDYIRAAELVEAAAEDLALAGRQVTAAGWLARLPAELRNQRPALSLADATVAGFSSDYAAMLAHLDITEAALARLDAPVAAPIARVVAAERALALSILGDERALELGRRALADLPERHPLRSTVVAALCYAGFYAGDLAGVSQLLEQALAAPHQHHRSIQAGLLALLAMVRRAQGRLREVRRLSTAALELAKAGDQTLPLNGALLALLLIGLTDCEQNNLDAAERALHECAQLARQHAVATYALLTDLYLAHVAVARGDYDRALGLLSSAEAAAGRYLPPANLREIAGYRALVWLWRGDLAAASAWAARYDAQEHARPPLCAYDYDRFALAQVLLAEQRWEQALSAATALVAAAEQSDHGRFLVWALLLVALAENGRGAQASADRALDRALALATPEGYVRMFVNQGAPMRALLTDRRSRLARGAGPMPMRYLDRLLATFGETARLIEPLTARELAVLRMVAQGYDNAAIAEALGVAVSTVKSHINQIFGKLGARSRIAAALRARELGLLADDG